MMEFYNKDIFLHLLADYHAFHGLPYTKSDFENAPLTYLQAMYCDEVNSEMQLETMFIKRMKALARKLESEMFRETNFESEELSIEQRWGIILASKPNDQRFIISRLMVELGEIIKPDYHMREGEYKAQETTINNLITAYYDREGTDFVVADNAVHANDSLGRFQNNYWWAGFSEDLFLSLNVSLAYSTNLIGYACTVDYPTDIKTISAASWFKVTKLYYLLAPYCDRLIEEQRLEDI